ncbi:MAG: ABC transporter permease subunit, partial [Planctomycetales bacterium]|nr:ABC transporter permease subunit [Planctomycetales bacterium]
GRIALPRTRSVTMLQRLAIVLGAVFVLSPVLALVLRGVAGGPAQLLARADAQGAVATSIVLGLVSALLATVSALALSAAHEAARRRVGGRSGVFGYATGAGANLVFAMPPLAIAAGWFVGIRLIADPWAFGAPLVASVNAMMALPFAIRFVQPAFDAAAARHNRLCAALGLFGWRRFAVVDWPAMRRPLATAFAFSMALGIGDLGVIALFGSDDLRTLPFLILQRMGSYRTADAAGLTLVLIVLVLALVWLADRLSAGEGEKQ